MRDPRDRAPQQVFGAVYVQERDAMTVSHNDMANAIRFLSVDAIENARAGHPGTPMGAADEATVLFSRYLKFDPAAPTWPDRDRFILSSGHACLLLYSLLYLTGYEEMTLEQLRSVRQFGSRTPGHPEYDPATGVETTTGPLGQGLATGVGMALAERLLNARFGDNVVDHYTYVLAGDGCLMEGISHEAISFAGHLGLSKLIVLWDDNRCTDDGITDLSVSDDQLTRFRACGWHVQSVDGHNPAAVSAAIETARRVERPSLIGCRTTIGYGAPTKAGTRSTHGAPLGEAEIALARDNLGWPHPPFVVPADVLSAWRAAAARGAQARQSWEARLAALEPARRDEFKRMVSGTLSDGWQDALEAYKRRIGEERPTWSTANASGEALEVLTAAIPELIGGSADLSGSVRTKTQCIEPITPGDFTGRYFHYGVREHAMAAAMNGMALHGGIVPYSGTFVVFSDYMRPAMRLAAMMKQRVIYVLTHDSIGMGGGGPTHQPVEHLPALRAMPNLNVLRPADAVETAECWAIALSDEDTPSALVLTKQDLPAVRTVHVENNLCARGAYVLAEADGARAVTLLATGSEVSVALAARETLQAEGVPTAVVSMPCWERFDAQDETYRKTVLGEGTVRIAIEAAARLGWAEYLGDNGEFLGVDTYGASAPPEELFRHFGITPEHVVAAAQTRLSGR